jgi:hypothetical protein
MIYEVQHYTLCDSWINTWTDTIDGKDVPSVFNSFEEALACLDEFLADTLDEFNEGNLSDTYDRNDFRIVKINEDKL